MPNTVEYAKRFTSVIDNLYKTSAVTADLSAATMPDFSGVNEVKVLRVSTNGLGDYSRNNGYPKGDVTANWQTMTLTEERGKEITIDRMDNEEVLGKVFGAVVGDFMRLHVVPELDAYRFARYAGDQRIQSAAPAALTKDTVFPAIDEAMRALTEKEVPLEGRRLYISSNLIPVISQAFARQYGSDSSVSNLLNAYNGVPIRYVPPSRFWSGITLHDGSENWGFKAAEGASPLNFMLLHPSALLQVEKFALPKIFNPDVNQDKDAWKFQFRLYHDCFIYDNKACAIYTHKSVTA